MFLGDLLPFFTFFDICNHLVQSVKFFFLFIKCSLESGPSCLELLKYMNKVTPLQLNASLPIQKQCKHRFIGTIKIILISANINRTAQWKSSINEQEVVVIGLSVQYRENNRLVVSFKLRKIGALFHGLKVCFSRLLNFSIQLYFSKENYLGRKENTNRQLEIGKKTKQQLETADKVLSIAEIPRKIVKKGLASSQTCR